MQRLLSPDGVYSSEEVDLALARVLAARLPAPFLAERLGFHQARAAKWVREAGRTYADYVALRVD
ncbi:MAG TPA: hypothetical protein VHV53_10320 [Solirubrobacterales bacterium]|nr:hypothetical protein [Solirubrobacterales bacterium]